MPSPFQQRILRLIEGLFFGQHDMHMFVALAAVDLLDDVETQQLILGYVVGPVD